MAKKSTKRQGKMRRFFNKLNPNSPAKKLVAFVLVFAVLGGGYYAYRSFASTEQGVVNGNIVALRGQFHLASSSSQHGVFLIDPSSGQQKKLDWATPDRVGYSLDFGRFVVSPDGYRVAYFECPALTSYCDLKHSILHSGGDTKHVARVNTYGVPPGQLNWSTDSKYLTFAGTSRSMEGLPWEQGFSDVYSVPAAGGTVLNLTGSRPSNYYSIPLFIDEKNIIVHRSWKDESGTHQGGHQKIDVTNKTQSDIELDITSGDKDEFDNYISSFFIPNNTLYDYNARTGKTLSSRLNDRSTEEFFIAVGKLESNTIAYEKTLKHELSDISVFKHPGWSPDGNQFYVNNAVFAASDGALVKKYGNEFDIIDWAAKYETFNPTGVTTRQTMSAFLYRVAGSPAVPTASQKCGTGKPGPFTDVKGDHPFCKEIEWMRATGQSTGYNDGTYKPTEKVTRQTMSAFLYRTAGSPSVPTATQKCGAGKPGPFTDVRGNHTFCKEIEWMRANGISTGYADGSYKPTETVTRQVMASFLHRQKGEPNPGQTTPLYADVPSNHQFFKAIQWLGEQNEPAATDRSMTSKKTN